MTTPTLAFAGRVEPWNPRELTADEHNAAMDAELDRMADSGETMDDRIHECCEIITWHRRHTLQRLLDDDADPSSTRYGMLSSEEIGCIRQSIRL